MDRACALVFALVCAPFWYSKMIIVPDAEIAFRLACVLWCAIFLPIYSARLYYCSFIAIVAVVIPDGLEYAPLLFSPVELWYSTRTAFKIG